MKPINQQWRTLRNLGMSLVACLALSTQTVNAQLQTAGALETAVGAGYSDLDWVDQVNTDMVEVRHLTNGNHYLKATVYSGHSFASGNVAELVVEVQGANPLTATSVALPTGALNPDVAIATNMFGNHDEDYLIGITYEDGAGNVYLTWSEMPGVGTTAVTTPTSPGLGTQLNATGANAYGARIDMSGTIDWPAYGGALWCLYNFGIVWEERTGGVNPPGIYSMIGFWGNPAGVAFFTSSPIAVAIGDYSQPDVACRGYKTYPSVPTGTIFPSRTLYFTYIDNSTSDLLLAEYTADKTILQQSPVATSVVGTGGGGISYAHPRIETYLVDDWMSTEAMYQIVAEENNGGINSIYTYNNLSTSTFTLNNAVSAPPFNHLRPVVAGVGKGCLPGGSTPVLSNTTYTLSYWTDYTHSGINGGTTEGDYFSNAIDMTGGLPSTTYTNYMEVNYNVLYNSISALTNEPKIAVSSSSNSGEDLLTVWYDGWDGTNGNLMHKQSGNSYAYKTTGIKNINVSKHYTVFPNPATTTLTVKGADKASYSIIDAIGKTVATGTINNNDNSVKINSLANGIYILALTENGYTQQVKFTKQ